MEKDDDLYYFLDCRWASKHFFDDIETVKEYVKEIWREDEECRESCGTKESFLEKDVEIYKVLKIKLPSSILCF